MQPGVVGYMQPVVIAGGGGAIVRLLERMSGEYA